MTVPTETSKSGPYAGAGTTGPFVVDFPFLEDGHLRVVKTDTDGVDTVLTLNVDYTVSGAGGSSGTVTLTDPLAVGELLTIVRSVPVTQEADYVPNDPFPAQSHERALDKLTMIAQQHSEILGRALQFPEALTGLDPVLPRPDPGKALVWNQGGTGIRNSKYDADAIADAAAQSAADALQSAQDAAQSAADADATYKDFDKRYLGEKPSDPSVDNEGNPLQEGALYWNTTTKAMRVYTGSQWTEFSSMAFVPAVFSGDGVETEFELPLAPISVSNVFVSVGGVDQTGAFTINDKTLIFDEAPPVGTDNIRVRVAQPLPVNSARAENVEFPVPGGAPTTLDKLAGAGGAAYVGDAVVRVENIAALRALDPPKRKTVVYVEGYYTPGDRGGGAFLWVPASTKADDGGTVIRPDSAPSNGRWERGIYDVVDIKMFGATGNLTDDQTPAFKALRDYLNTQRLGPSSGALENSVAGIRVVAPRGVYRLTEQVVFGPYLSIDFDFQHAEVYYNGPALPDDEGAIVFHNLSWVSVKNVYSYTPLEFRSCYRVHAEGIKIQGKFVVNDCWNFKALSCWNYFGQSIIRGGHQHNYDNCAFEFGANDDVWKVTIQNPDTVSFTNCYTEWLGGFLRLEVTSTYDNFRGVIFDNCFLDVQTKAALNNPNRPLMVFENTSSAPVIAPIRFRNCNFNSAGGAPAAAADGIWLTADDTFMDITLEGCWAVQANQPIHLGTLFAASAVSFSRVFKGAGIRIKEWEPPDTGCKINNGRFTYAAIPNGNANTSDPYREGNLGWVYTGSISGGVNGNGAISLTTGSNISRDMPVAYSGRRLTHKALRPGYYWLVVATKNGSVQITAQAMVGSGSGKTGANIGGSSSVIVSGYPSTCPTSQSTVAYTKTLLYIPRFDSSNAEVTWLRITLQPNHASLATTFYGVGLHMAGSFPSAQFEDGREEIALTAAPVHPGDWQGQEITKRDWSGSGTRFWKWDGSTWAAIG